MSSIPLEFSFYQETQMTFKICKGENNRIQLYSYSATVNGTQLTPPPPPAMNTFFCQNRSLFHIHLMYNWNNFIFCYRKYQYKSTTFHLPLIIHNCCMFFCSAWEIGTWLMSFGATDTRGNATSFVEAVRKWWLHCIIQFVSFGSALSTGASLIWFIVCSIKNLSHPLAFSGA